MKENQSIAFLKEYRAHPDKYLPLIDHQYKHFDEWDDEITRNLGWDAGILEGNRPYFAECWKIFQATSLTVFFSSEGYEKVGNDLFFMLELIRAGLIAVSKEGIEHVNVKRIRDGSGHEFISFNCVLSVEGQGTYSSWLGGTCSFDELNLLNEDVHTD